MSELTFFATVPRGLESLLAGELRSLGAATVRQARAGVSFSGDLETAYRACLWSRLAVRVLLPLAHGAAGDGDELYATVGGVDWSEHLGPDQTLAVDFTGVNRRIRDTRYGGVRVKDAIVDQVREKIGERPSVDPRAPYVRVNAHLAGSRVTVSLDLSGQSLHRRGYRADRVQVEAPLKENLAAGVLSYAAWPKLAAAGGSLVDPLCGSGTLPIEAALMAADVAPGLLRAEADHVAGPKGRSGATAPAFGFLRWRGHQEQLWLTLVAEARERRAAGLGRLAAARPDVSIRGSDRDARAVALARDCVRRAGLHGLVRIDQAELARVEAPAAHGLVATNAPYGERLEEAQAEIVYRELGEKLRAEFAGWNAAVLAGDRRQLAAVGLAPKRETDLRNGPLECVLAFFEAGAAPTGPAAPRSARAAVRSAAPRAASQSAGPVTDRPAGAARMLGGGAEYLANRLRKNRRRLARRLQREGITCYRLYDADLPEYNLVVDVYGEVAHVQEYAAPPEVDPVKARRRLDEALDVIAAVLELPRSAIVLKERRRQRGSAQYERRADQGRLVPVDEDGLTYLVDLSTYLDTGFFIDQRATRRLVRRLAGGRRFLNLFAYTGTMTVNALAGGSPSSTTVDLSATYLAWAERNLSANGFTAAQQVWAPDAPAQAGSTSPTPAHTLVRADCLRWVAEADGAYDLIWLDPPTFSNSKRMGRATFDVQRDHADLIRMTVRRLLAPGGVLLFSTNRRHFRLDHDALGGLDVKDLSRATLAFDCERSANRHHVVRIEHGRT
ncbi:MAG: bifunctional 23S rRNA (guanine(2069)-N(7))-methyltransferase RlmK/23S rRNA (guanine(2445)-N(2))-methyltransferase RlmL [Actinobacteria bacterium]|nr:bifunctional 23S rRNA (guanine(2069)-N(7))-methyltransferase RlmK/23S rRNA (guanine(2445)-N(2))-methyltransferase RlmL [Actinomycetota bacterium]